MAVASSLLDQLLMARPLAGALLGALALDLIVSRAGAGWGWGGWRPASVGVLAGAGAAGLAAVGGAALGQAHPVVWGLDVIGLVTGVAAVIASATRDELLWRWGPWQLLSPWLSPSRRSVLVVALGVAAAWGASAPGVPAGSLLASLAVASAAGALSTVLLRRVSGPAAAIAATAAVRLLANPTPLGVEVRWSSGALSPLLSARGPGAWWLAAALGLAALVSWRLQPPAPASSERS